MKLIIKLIDIDDSDRMNKYYLYEVESDDFQYYVSRSDEELNNTDEDTFNYTNEFLMFDRDDLTNREWEIAKYLFIFLWDSDNGTNTCVDKEIYEEDGFSEDEIAAFIEQYHLEEIGVLELYEDGGVEIYWSYFSCFNLKTCNFWED